MNRLPKLLLAVWVALVAAPASGQGLSPAQTRHAVAVRASSPSTGVQPESGGGLIVGADRGWLYVVTARHVVEFGGEAAEEVSVLFHGTATWVQAARVRANDEVAKALGDLDLAVLRTRRSDAPAAHASAYFTDLHGARLARPGQRGLLRGDPTHAASDKRTELRTVPITISGLTDKTVTFSGDGVRRGFSGGPIYYPPSFVVGIATDAGASGTGHRGIALSRIREALTTLGVPCGIEMGPIPSALEDARRNGRSCVLTLLGLGRGVCKQYSVAIGRATTGVFHATIQRQQVAMQLVDDALRITPLEPGATATDFRIVDTQPDGMLLLSGSVEHAKGTPGWIAFFSIPASNNTLVASRLCDATQRGLRVTKGRPPATYQVSGRWPSVPIYGEMNRAAKRKKRRRDPADVLRITFERDEQGSGARLFGKAAVADGSPAGELVFRTVDGESIRTVRLETGRWVDFDIPIESRPAILVHGALDTRRGNGRFVVDGLRIRTTKAALSHEPEPTPATPEPVARDPRLETIIRLWPQLSDATREAILAMVKASAPEAKKP